jgi:putative spermidine/putrescine transport system ATP-binding protein
MPDIQITNLTKKFGRYITALDGIDLQVNDGEYIAVLGPSGCGKTTLINCITGIVDMTEGEITIDGQNVNGIPIENRDFAMVFQSIALFPHMNVGQNVTYAPFVNDVAPSEQAEIEEEMLKLVDLLEQKKLYPRSLSGGAQQKTALARALATREKLLILDEPISALDYKVRVNLRYAIHRLVKEFGLTAIHITHDQEEVMSIADRLVIMRAGKIVEIGTPQELYRSPKSLFTMHFVGESNFLEGVISENSSSEIIEIMFRNEQLYRLSNKKWSLSEGEGVVVAFRPENANFSIDFVENSLEGKIVEKRFMYGGYFRYTINLETEDKVILDSKEDIQTEKRVFIHIDPDEVRVFRTPPYGLKKVLSLE